MTKGSLPVENALSKLSRIPPICFRPYHGEPCRLTKVFRYGARCPGYRPPAAKDLHFVDQTRHVVRKAGSELVQEQAQPGTGPSMQYQWRHKFYEPTKSHSIIDISKQQMHRVQLLSTFLDLYLPKQHDKSMISHFDYIANLPHIDLASPLLQVSIDTICLAEIGSLYQDERCLQESRMRYVRALPMLARELAKPISRQIQKDHILAAITILALCELFDGIARGSLAGQGWISHMNGAQEYIRANGPKGIMSPFAWQLFHNIRHSAMCLGFTTRKAVFFAEPKWLKLTSDQAKRDPYVALYDITLQIPGVMERADALPISKANPTAIASVVQYISRLRFNLDVWLHSFYTQQQKQIYKIVDVSNMKEFSQLCMDRTFQTVFDFESIQICTQQQLRWISCLVLDFTLLAISRRFLGAECSSGLRLQDLTVRTQEDVERDLFVSATSYCRSVPYCCEPQTASVGRLGTFLLRITQSYFEQSGRCREMEWCNSVRSMLETAASSHKGLKEPLVHNVSSAPWAVEHRCKSPICNFRVECVAPAPLLLIGEYPNKGFAPRHMHGKIKMGHASSGDHSDAPAAKQKAEDIPRVPTASSKKRDMFFLGSPPLGHRDNGTSALADERIIVPGFEPVLMRDNDAGLAVYEQTTLHDVPSESPAWSTPRPAHKEDAVL